jgi:hypothetical protein
MNQSRKFNQEMAKKQQQQQRNMQMAWWKQQEDKRRQEQERQQQGPGAAQAGAPASQVQPGGFFQVDERFTQVEAEVARLNQELAADHLPADKFREQMQALMVQDEKGSWWMIGSETGAWYCYDGSSWVQSNPPGRWLQAGGAPALHSDFARSTGSANARPTTHRFAAFIFLIGGLFATAGLGFWVGNLVDGSLPGNQGAAMLAAGVVWLIGLIITFRNVRRLWRGY